MKKLIVCAAAAAMAFGSFAEVKTLPIKNGDTRVPYTSKMIGLKAVSDTAAGTIAVKEVLYLPTSSTQTIVSTNVTPKDATYQVGDAYVGQDIVHTGTADLKWLKSVAVVTNISDSVTNVVTYKLAQWCDGSTTNSVVWTNCAHQVKFRDMVAVAPITNIVTRQVKIIGTKPVTNDLYSATLSGGYKSEMITNKLVLGGSLLVTSGTALENGNAYIVLEK